MPTPLDAIAIAALRKADRVSFHHHATVGNWPGESHIHATKENKRTAADPFAPLETTIAIVTDATLRNYETRESCWYDAAAYDAFEMVYSYQETWQTIAALLKVGDCLQLNWACGGMSSPVLTDAGMVGDTLHLVIIRGEKRMTFLIDVQIGAPSCRMVKVRSVKPVEYTLAIADA